jgi:hypothetical protein
MPRTLAALLLLIAIGGSAVVGADRKWQTGTWADISTKRRMVDFGPGSSGFGRPGSSPQMKAMAEIRRFVIETDDLRLEAEDTVPVGRRSIDVSVGGMVTFALDKNALYIRMADGSEQKLRLVKKTARTAESNRKPEYSALGGGHVVRAVTGQGQFVTLEDGSRWEISPRDQYQTMDWEVLANVSVRMLPRAENGFVYELINTSTDEGAVANYRTRQ